jgi:hypothetical protein
MADQMKITVFSMACCNPSLAVYDDKYVAKINEALQKMGAQAKVEVIHGTDALYDAKLNFIRKLGPQLNKYGLAVTPALFINEELALYGGVPPIEKIEEAIAKAKSK